MAITGILWLMQGAIDEKAAAQRRAHDEAVARSAAEQREQVGCACYPITGRVQDAFQCSQGWTNECVCVQKHKVVCMA